MPRLPAVLRLPCGWCSPFTLCFGHPSPHLPQAVFFLTESQASAPYLVEWDTWREAGVSHSKPLKGGTEHVGQPWHEAGARSHCWVCAQLRVEVCAGDCALAIHRQAPQQPFGSCHPAGPMTGSSRTSLPCSSQAQVHPLYVAEAAAAVGSNGGAAGASAEALLERELFGGEGGLAGVLGGAHAAKEAAVSEGAGTGVAAAFGAVNSLASTGLGRAGRTERSAASAC